jgi:hypothetical protein
MRQAPGETVAIAHLSGKPGDIGSHRPELVRRQIHHGIHAGRVVGRALEGHPAQKPIEHALRVEWESGEVGKSLVLHIALFSLSRGVLVGEARPRRQAVVAKVRAPWRAARQLTGLAPTRPPLAG